MTFQCLMVRLSVMRSCPHSSSRQHIIYTYLYPHPSSRQHLTDIPIPYIHTCREKKLLTSYVLRVVEGDKGTVVVRLAAYYMLMHATKKVVITVSDLLSFGKNV